MPKEMALFLKITGVEKMALNRLHELLEGDSFKSAMLFKRYPGWSGAGDPLQCVSLLDAKLDGETYTIKLKVVLSTHQYTMEGKAVYFLTSRAMLELIFQALEIMPESEKTIEISK